MDLKETLQYLVSLGRPVAIEADGAPYINPEFTRVSDPTITPLCVHDLQGIVDYVQAGFDVRSAVTSGVPDDLVTPAAIVVLSPLWVQVVSAIRGRYAERNILASALRQPYGAPFNQYLDQERFITWLQTGFVRDLDWTVVVDVASAVTAQSIVTHSDDGVSQTVSVLDGIQRQHATVIPSPVLLRAYRTFEEIEQPVSALVLRMRKGEDGATPVMGLFEITGDSWHVHAVESIGAFLRARVSLPVLA